MICPSCGKENPDGAKFCRFCGTKIEGAPAPQETTAFHAVPVPPVRPEQPAPNSDPPAVVIPIAATPAYMQSQENGGTAEEPKKKKGPLFKKRAKKAPAPQTAPQPEMKTGASANPITPGRALLAAFLAIECLPYIVDSFLLLAKKSPLGVFTVSFIDILCYAAAFGLLVGASKLITGKAKTAPSLLIVGVIIASRSAASALTLAERGSVGGVRAILIGAALLIIAVTAAVIVKPLGSLFSQNGKCRQGGRLTSFLLIFAALLSPIIFDMLKVVFSYTVTISFISTFAYKLLIAAAEAALLTCAVNKLLKKQAATEQPASGAGVAAELIAGGALFAAAVVVTSITMITFSTAYAIVADVANYSLRGRIYMSGGDMTSAVNAFEQAGEHSSAWLAISGEGSYTTPEKYRGDPVLMYLEYINDSSENLRRYLVNSLNEEEIDLWCPLMLGKYAEKDNLSEEEEAHRKEMLVLCIGSECFVNKYPTTEEIQKHSADITEALSANTEFEKDLFMAKVYAGAQKCSDSPNTLLDELMDASEQYPNDMSIQYAAAYIGSENRWDNASHYEKTAEAALRFRKLFSEKYGASDPEKVLANDSSVAGMLVNVQKYDEAEKILEDLIGRGSDTKENMQLLSICYTELNENKKGDELSKKMYQTFPDDVTVIRTYFLSTLKGGETKEAIEAAGKLADIVKSDPKDGDPLLFNCVSYLTVRDSEAWTDFQYDVYTKDSSDEPRREIAKNEFLDEYCAAVFNDYMERDYDEALKHVDKALSFQENSGRLWYLKGLILYNQKKFEDAEKALLKADSLDPDDASTLYAIANNYDAMKRYEESYEYCERVVAKYPNGADHGEDWYGIAPHAQHLMSSLEPYVKGGK